MHIGLSTGDFWNTNIKPISNEVLDYIFNLGCTTVELGASDRTRWIDFAGIGSEKVTRFPYRSLHAPSDMTREDALFIKKMQDTYSLHAITVHPLPHTDWKMLKEVGLRVAVENMDNKKDYGKSPGSIKGILDEFGFGWVLDVNHIYTHDKSMELTKDFVRELGKPQHIHMSGYQTSNIHTLLYKTKQDEIIRSAIDLAPIIIESELDLPEDAEPEFLYISHVLNNERQR